jgi:hypothetical protein
MSMASAAKALSEERRSVARVEMIEMVAVRDLTS